MCSYKVFEANQNVCLNCQQHCTISARKRVEFLVDKSTFKEYDASLKSVDVLDFFDVKPYSERLNASTKMLQVNDALLSGSACIATHSIQIAVFDFRFMGGSMGSVVGEKISRAIDHAIKFKSPF